MKQKCAEYNSIGECVRIQDIGSELVLSIKPEALACNPIMAERAQQLIDKKQISVVKKPVEKIVEPLKKIPLVKPVEKLKSVEHQEK